MTKIPTPKPPKPQPRTAKAKLQRFYKNHKKAVIITLIIVLLIELFIAQFFRFGFATIRCMHLPVSVTAGSTFAGGSGKSSYYMPGLPGYNVGGYSQKYYCSVKEAEAMGHEPGIGIDIASCWNKDYYDSLPDYYLPSTMRYLYDDCSG